MSGIVAQRHKHLAVPLPMRLHVVLNNGDAAGVAVLVAQPFEDPLRRVSLLFRPSFIRRQDGVDDSGNASIFATVRGSTPKRRAASRRLIPSI
jgi:hypothetical protein